jgi:hypothetical protein
MSDPLTALYLVAQLASPPDMTIPLDRPQAYVLAGRPDGDNRPELTATKGDVEIILKRLDILENMLLKMCHDSGCR